MDGRPWKVGAFVWGRAVEESGRDKKNKLALGGLRRPAWAVERHLGLRDVGLGVGARFDEFCKKFPDAGEGYGSPTFELKYGKEWGRALREHFKLSDQGQEVRLKRSLEYRWSPVEVDLLGPGSRPLLIQMMKYAIG